MKDDPFDDPFFDDAREDMKTGLQIAVLAKVVGVLVAGGSAIAGAVVAWTYAPPVAGDWYPYIRAIVALVGAGAGVGIGCLLATVIYGIAMWALSDRIL